MLVLVKNLCINGSKGWGKPVLLLWGLPDGQDGPKACDSLLSFDECFDKDGDDGDEEDSNATVNAGNVGTVGTVGC